MGLSGRKLAYLDPRQRVFALEPHEMSRKHREAFNHAAALMRLDDGPVRARLRRQRRAKQREVLGPVGVGENVKRVAMRLEVVTQSLFPLCCKTRRRPGVGKIDQMAFARIMAVNGDQGEASVARLPHRDRPSRVLLFENENVARRVFADDMTIDLHGAMIVVDAHIKEALGVLHPDDRPVRVLDEVGAIDAACDGARADRVELRTGVVDAPAKLRMVARMRRFRDLEKLRALAQRVAVEQNLLGAAVARRSAI